MLWVSGRFAVVSAIEEGMSDGRKMLKRAAISRETLPDRLGGGHALSARVSASGTCPIGDGGLWVAAR
jgi:hypothetical protein